MAECFFCGVNARLTRAHLLQQTFRDAVVVPTHTVRFAATSAAETGVYSSREYAGDIRQTKVTSLCVSCNSGWMNGVEQAAGPVFKDLVAGSGLPSAGDLFKLAHWSVIVGSLLSELVPRLTIPEEHRRAIRFTRTGQPQWFSTYVIETADEIDNWDFDIVRIVSEAGEEGWISVIRGGKAALISASPLLMNRARGVLDRAGVQGMVGAISSNLMYTPDASSSAAARLTHEDVRLLFTELFGAHQGFFEAAGSGRVVNMDGGLAFRKDEPAPATDRGLVDVRDQLDLSYLDGVFDAAN